MDTLSWLSLRTFPGDDRLGDPPINRTSIASNSGIVPPARTSPALWGVLAGTEIG